jgi:hypothetical protein
MASEAELQSSRLPDSEPWTWDQSVALREAVRIYLPAEVAAVVDKGVGGGFHGWLEQWAEALNVESHVEVCLSAARADLQYTARFLAHIARETLVECESPPADEDLGWLADSVAVRVEELADLVTEKLGRVRPAVPAADEAVEAR